jgi:hypothetical protein
MASLEIEIEIEIDVCVCVCVCVGPVMMMDDGWGYFSRTVAEIR